RPADDVRPLLDGEGDGRYRQADRRVVQARRAGDRAADRPRDARGGELQQQDCLNAVPAPAFRLAREDRKARRRSLRAFLRLRLSVDRATLFYRRWPIRYAPTLRGLGVTMAGCLDSGA